VRGTAVAKSLPHQEDPMNHDPIVATPMHAALREGHKRRPLMDRLRRLAWGEFSLIEACYEAAAQSDDGEAHALLRQQANAAQEHLVELDNLLRRLGERPVSYARCVRHALLRSTGVAEMRRRLDGAYEQLLARADLPSALRRLLERHAAAHRKFTRVEAACAA
jgi:hypothetical protein